MNETSRILLDNKHIKEFESILNEISDCSSRIKGTLSVNDIAHALYLMRAFVAYPSNYAGIKFDSEGKEL